MPIFFKAVRFSALAGVGSGLPFSRRTYPLLSRLRSHHDRAFRPLLLRCPALQMAREVGREGSRSPSVSHSTPWASGSLAACLAHPSATSFPKIPLCAGHQQLSISEGPARCYRLPRLKGVGLARARLVARDRGLYIGEDADSAELAPLGSLRCHR